MCSRRPRSNRRTWETDFHYAARTGDLPTVLSALRAGYDPDKRDQRGRTALLLAAQYGHVDVARALLEHGAKVGPDEQYRICPLAISILWSHPEVALLLLEYGADGHSNPDDGDLSILSIAVCYRLHSVVQALLLRGADPNYRDHRGKTALSYTRETGDRELVWLLEQAGAQE